MASRQTQVVSMIHAATCIQPVASETIVLENGKSRTFIPGIEEVMRAAFDRETMLREQGFSLESVVLDGKR